MTREEAKGGAEAETKRRERERRSDAPFLLSAHEIRQFDERPKLETILDDPVRVRLQVDDSHQAVGSVGEEKAGKTRKKRERSQQEAGRATRGDGGSMKRGVCRATRKGREREG